MIVILYLSCLGNYRDGLAPNGDTDNDADDIVKKFNRELLKRLPNTEFAEKIFREVNDIYKAELKERIGHHMEQSRLLEQSRKEIEALTHSLVAELYRSMLEKAAEFDSSNLHK